MAEIRSGDGHAFRCRQCGGQLVYAPGTTLIRCTHCGFENPIEPEASPIEELDYRAALAALEQNEPHAEQETIKCASCAAEFSFDPDIHADSCPYCGGAIVKATGRHSLVVPRALVPFQLTEKEAQGRLRAWLGSLWFAPSALTRYAQQEGRLTGVYLPYWTYDAETETDYAGERGTAHQVPRTVVVHVQGKPVRQTQYVTEIRWTPVRGRVARFFDDVLVLASRTLPQGVVDRLGSWRLEGLVPYRKDYLSGFRSEAYQVDVRDGFGEAQARMKAVIEMDVRRAIGGDAQRVHALRTRFGAIHFKHILLPVWAAAYRYRDKIYRFVVNGQTGEVQGERPYSAWKIAVAVVFAVLVAGAALYLFMAAQGGVPADGFYPPLHPPTGIQLPSPPPGPGYR